MFTKGIYAGRPASFQLMILLALVAGGTMLSSGVGIGVASAVYGYTDDMMQSPGVLRVVLFLSSAGTFLLPAWALAWLCGNQAGRFLSVKGMPEAEVLGLVLVCMLLLSPVINLSEFFNKQMELPAFMEPIEAWMREQETEAEEMATLLTARSDAVSFLSNLLVMALMAAVTEEFLFRGALLRIIGKAVANRHLVIWITAATFSAFHLQFFGFLPRMLLGAYFGYLLYWSGNIWIPVFAHLMNNTIAVAILSYPRLQEYEFLTGELSDDMVLPYAAVAGVAGLLLIPLLKRLKKRAARSVYLHYI
ncbi:CAAX amino terminal protease self- immunity [Bacteroidales bacterium Barb6]|nr:CAAX amino terminal protease self- immunity [Bacteroidales bacterium Barb6]